MACPRYSVACQWFAIPALDKLKFQQKKFVNPKRMITDKGSPFNSQGFDDYCTEESIQNLQITTGVPPRERSSGENPPNSNPCFDQVVNRRSYKMVQILRPTSKNSKQHLQLKYQVVSI
ncbi:pro-Pol polyprotein [Trichonephila clavipes]|nr:pro-Pol polyprotein [Trichonephila clavipes]